MKMKRILSAVLVFCLCLTMLPAITIQTGATAVSYAEMLARAEAIVNYQWTPSQRIYTWNGNTYNGKSYFEVGQTVTGMPYTLFSWELGFDSLLSLSQYKNKVSSNYSITKYCNSVSANRTGPAYGSCCATFVSEVFGGSFMNGSNPLYDSVYAIKTSSYGTTYTGVTVGNIKSGDALSNTSGSHIVWVGNITDSTITIYEQTPPVAKKTVVSKSSVNSSGYLVHEGSVYSTVTRSKELSNVTITHNVNSSYGTNFTAYPKAEITAANIFDANHNQIDSSSCIWTTDLCTIHEVYTDGCCKLTYPLDSGGTKTVYSKISLFNLHTHSFTGPRYYEGAHPHAITQRCVDYDTCGGWIYTGEYYELNTCEQCWYITFNVGASSVSTKVGESETISMSLNGCWPDSKTIYVDYDTDIVEISISNNQATFTGLKAGTTNFSIIIYSDSTKSHIIGSVTIPITVTNKTYTISYNANGGSGAPDDQTKYHGTELTLSSTKPSRTGYTFMGWSTSSSATSASYQPGGKFNLNADTTLYAVWGKGCEDDNHKYVYDVTGRPTSTATGKIVGECGYCGEKFSVLLPKLNTDDYNYQVTRAATCTATGMGRYTWKTTKYGGSYYFDEAIPVTGHSYVALVTAPTCTVNGYTVYTCSGCGDSYRTEEQALGHSYNAVITAPTCTSNGYTTNTCTLCGNSYISNHTDQLSHNYNAVITEPTCTMKGYTTYTCTSCSHSYVSDYTNMLGHQVEDGICTVCNKVFIEITAQPKTGYAVFGDYAKTTAKISGDGLTYQWYVKDVGDTKYYKSSIQKATYSCKMSSTTNGRYAKCKITDAYGNYVWTDTVRLWTKATITTEPVNKTIKSGTTAKFTVKAVGKGLSYQWQYRTSSSGSWKNSSASSAKTATYKVSAEARHNGYQYRCRITDSAGNKVYTKTVTLNVLGIKTQPASKTVKVGATAKFTVKAVGKGLSFQWQYRTSSSGSWKNVSASSGKTASYTLATKLRHNGYQYRCKITDSAGNVIYTNIVKLTVKK